MSVTPPALSLVVMIASTAVLHDAISYGSFPLVLAIAVSILPGMAAKSFGTRSGKRCFIGPTIIIFHKPSKNIMDP